MPRGSGQRQTGHCLGWVCSVTVARSRRLAQPAVSLVSTTRVSGLDALSSCNGKSEEHGAEYLALLKHCHVSTFHHRVAAQHNTMPRMTTRPRMGVMTGQRLPFVAILASKHRIASCSSIGKRAEGKPCACRGYLLLSGPPTLNPAQRLERLGKFYQIRRT